MTGDDPVEEPPHPIARSARNRAAYVRTRFIAVIMPVGEDLVKWVDEV